MNPPNDRAERVWERGWDGHRVAQLRRLARLSLPEKIAWLEQAQRVAQWLAKQQPPPSEKRNG